MKKQMNKKFWRTFGTVFLEALVIVTVILVFLWMNQLAYYSFSNVPYDKNKEQEITVQITDNTEIMDLSDTLKQKEIVGSRYAMVIRYYCSDYQYYELCPGTYQISADMGIDDLLDEFTGR